MGTTAKQIEVHIEHTRDALSANLEELEQKVKTATDWRHHFRTKPTMLLSIAFGGGILLAAVAKGRSNRGETGRYSTPRAGDEPFVESVRRADVVRQPWDKVKGAIIAAATARLLSHAAELFPGLRRKS